MIAVAGEAIHRSIEHLDNALAAIFARNADGQVREAVVVKVAGGKRGAERVAGFIVSFHAIHTLPQFVSAIAQKTDRAAAENGDQAAVAAFARRADRQIGVSVAIKIPSDHVAAKKVVVFAISGGAVEALLQYVIVFNEQLGPSLGAKKRK
ncbi:MAG: hypothetical protein R2748_27770 [Bryobacterales bacterium]